MSEEEGTDGSGSIADSERGERQQSSGRRMTSWKENLAEDQRRAGAVNEEVVVLECAPDPTGKCNLLRRSCGYRNMRISELCGGSRHAHVTTFRRLAIRDSN